jgi:hypothetical protein
MLEQLLEAIKELTATLQETITIARGESGESGEEEEAAAPAAPEKKTRRTRKGKTEEDEVSLDDVRAALKALIDAGDNETVKKLLKKHGGAKLGDIDASKYAALKADAETTGGGEDDLL